jgi:hypothetical protein
MIHGADSACSSWNVQAAHTIAGLLVLSESFDHNELLATFPCADVAGRGA